MDNPVHSTAHPTELRAEEAQERRERFLPPGRDYREQMEAEGFDDFQAWIEARERREAA